VADDPSSSVPGERRLERPPSERYLDAPPDGEPTAGSPGRGLVWGASAALLGALAITVGVALLDLTAGLLVVGAVVGWATALAVAAGAGDSLDRRGRAALAIVLALAGVALGQLGLWLLAREEGGVLGLTDYLGETFGILVPLELALAAISAWWRSR
jgi:hypothetical protein